MRSVRLTQSRRDCLALEVGRDVPKAMALTTAMVFTVGMMLAFQDGSAAGPGVMLLGSLLCLTQTLLLVRALRQTQHSLVRSGGKILLDGDLLEHARVELRARHLPFVKVPAGYVLSLWVTTLAGPGTVALGRYRTLLEASAVSGQLEDFLAEANFRRHRVS